MYSRLLAAALFLIACIALQADTPAPPANQMSIPAQRVFTGQTQAIGNGTISSWVMLDAAGHPSMAGMTLSEAALTNLPAVETEYPLALPPQAGETPFKQFVINWEPQGHFPQQFYGAPHFDFHFYMITPEERNKITGVGADMARMEKMPPADLIPQGYQFAPGGSVPYMGSHWVNPASPEFHGQPFTTTFIYGFYNGRMIFYEPMMTLAFLQTKPNVTNPFGQPAKFPASGYYPMQYSVNYDAAHHLYVIALQGFANRK